MESSSTKPENVLTLYMWYHVLGNGADKAAVYGQLPGAACQVMSRSVCAHMLN